MRDPQGLVFLVVIGTSIWVWIDAAAKAKISPDHRVAGRRPFEWFLISLLLWIICFPLYLVKRGQAVKRPQRDSTDSRPNSPLSVLEQERLKSKQEVERQECLERAAALEARYAQSHEESLIPRIKALRAAAEAAAPSVETVPRPTSPPNPSEGDQSRKALEAKWESRTPEDLLQEARTLTEQYKDTHDNALVPRIQALRRTAEDRRKGKVEPSTFRRPQHPGTTTKLTKLAKYVLVILGGLIVVSWIFTKACINSPRLEEAERRASDTQAGEATDQAAPPDKWEVNEGRSTMDDSRTVSLTLDAENQIEGPLGKTSPYLVIRCKENKTDVYVVTGMAANIETDLDGGPTGAHTVRLRIDQEPAVADDWGESTDHKALFASDIIYDSEGHMAETTGGTIQFAKKLARAQTLAFEFTPFDGSPQTARFAVRGLDAHLGKVADACGWTFE